jgi:hypothetical protein
MLTSFKYAQWEHFKSAFLMLKERNNEKKNNSKKFNDKSRDSIVGIATSYGLDDKGVGVRVPVGSRIFSSSRRPDRPWGPPNLSNGSRGVKQTTHLQLVRR